MRRAAASHRESAGERGSGTVLGIAVLAVILVVALAMLTLSAGLAARQRVTASADAAALAAADVALGVVPGSPCQLAERVAAANGAGLVRCELDGTTATVVAVGHFAGVELRATSRAGPPPGPH